MLEEDFEREIKVLVVGNGSVGKTSMIRRFCRGVYTDEYKKTIGVDFLEKTVYVNALGEDVRMMVWDTAGQEEFDAMTRTYYRGAGACVIAFSTTDRNSFDAVASWKHKVEAEVGSIPMALVQNKVDLIDSAVMSPDEAEDMARTLGLKFYRTCVKENLNVQEVFKYLAELNDRRTKDGTMGQMPRPAGGAQVFDKPGLPVLEDSKKGVRLGSGGEKKGNNAAGGESFTIGGPSKKRTKGKKKLSQRLTSCSVL